MTDGMKTIYGIDLGTTYSCIARTDKNGTPEVLDNQEGDSTTPSVVYFEDAETAAVGQSAKDELPVSPTLVVSCVKREMGRPDWKFQAHGEELTAPGVSAFILRSLADDAEMRSGQPATDVVITCPAYFGVVEKEATKQAGELAGLTVHAVVPEPTAAAISYSVHESDEDQNLLVYDLGGGTFDVTVVRVTRGRVDVVCTGGDHDLGGRNWDEAVAAYFGEKYAEATGTDLAEIEANAETGERLLLEAEAAKKNLSRKKKHLASLRHGHDLHEMPFTKEEFEDLTVGLMEQTLQLTRELVEVAREKGCDTIDKVLLVGGSTHMPQVELGVKNEFPDLEVLKYDPDEAVAKGAALLGLQLAAQKHIDDLVSVGEDPWVDLKQRGCDVKQIQSIVEKKTRNVTAKSFGIAIFNPKTGESDLCANLITANASVPVTATDQFGSVVEGTGVMIECIENDEPGTEEFKFDRSQKIGDAELDFGKTLPARTPLEVMFEMNGDGLLSVRARELTTEREVHVEFKLPGALTKEEMEEEKKKISAISLATD